MADDDDGDRLLFNEALRDLPFAVEFTPVTGGEHLMDYLQHAQQLPHILFLDLNMPRKNGFDCLREIKQDKKLRALPVVIFSTSDDEQGVERAYLEGAHLYLVKPAGFLDLISGIKHVIGMSLQPGFSPLPKDNFVVKVPDT
ncbi:MAG TPA: response regulator [Chitinophagales bacterium]|nr:response regulator [Chitinophagales bacterium]